jgi:IclR family acetate operon transcriptional repressor
MRAGFYQVILVRIEGSTPLRYQLPIGEKLPLQLGGARVLAAAMSAAQISELSDAVGDVVLASGDTLGKADFVRSLEAISEQGYAFGISQRVPGAASVAVPVFSREGAVLGALQVSGLEDDFAPADVDRLVDELRRASSAITHRHP